MLAKFTRKKNQLRFGYSHFGDVRVIHQTRKIRAASLIRTAGAAAATTAAAKALGHLPKARVIHNIVHHIRIAHHVLRHVGEHGVVHHRRQVWHATSTASTTSTSTS